MNAVEAALESRTAVSSPGEGLVRKLWAPAVIALAAVVVVLLAIVGNSTSAWQLLGIGRGLVPPEYYHVSGFIIVLATTLGQAVGWAGGSGIAYYILTLVGFPRASITWKLAMSVVYLGLGALPLFFYHVLFGAPLLGLDRAGTEQTLLERYPDASWLISSVHPVADLSLIPLGVVFLALLWLTGDSPRQSRPIQIVLALAMLGTSLAVALSLAIHSTLAHVKLPV